MRGPPGWACCGVEPAFDAVMKFSLLIALSPLLFVISCSSFKRPGPVGSGAVPTEARPEDMAKVDEFFKNGGRFG